MPFSASLLLRLRRLARGRGARVLAGLLAFALVTNALVVVAVPAIASAQMRTASATPAHEACAQHTVADRAGMKMAEASHRHQHADDCLCCFGKLCACGPLCGAASFIALQMGMTPAQGAIAASSLPRAYATVSPRPLRPPIA